MNDIHTELDSLRAEVSHLRQEVAMYRGIFEQSPIGTYVYQLEDLADDRTLRMVAANPVVEELAGLPPDAIVGKTLDDNFPGLREQGIPQAFAEVVRSGEPFEMESIYGDENVITSAFAFRGVALPHDCVAVTFENITARKKAEHALQQLNAELEQRIQERTEELRYNQALLQTVMDTAPAAIYIKDLNGYFLLVNRRTSSLLGMSPEEMQGKLDTELFPAEFAAQWRANEQRAIDAGTSISIEETVMQQDGLHTFLSIRTPIYDSTGQIHAIGGIATDITERKRQEEELRLFKLSVERANEGIGFTDAQGKIIYSNPAHRALFGYGDEIIGMSITDTVAPEGAALLETGMQAVFTHGSWRGESINRRNDGSIFPVEVSIFTVQDDTGAIQTVVGFVRDITERKQQEQEREALQQQVIDAQRNALRELSTPLIPISHDVMIMPLIGTIDSQRAQQVMEALLEGVAQHQASLVILDITGVAVVDTQVAQAFIQAAQAVRLLGAQVMLTGIQPQIAQTLVHLGVDLSGIITRGSLQAGIAYALNGK